MSEVPPGNPDDPGFLMKAVKNSASRAYLMIAAAALLILVVTMFLNGSPLAAAVIFITGLTSLLRWTAMPVFTILAVAYLLYAPLGINFERTPFSMIPGSYFKLMDLLVIGSLLIFVLGVYRLYALNYQAMPFEAKGEFIKRTATPAVRIRSEIEDAELIRFFLRIGIYLLAGQLLWLIVVNLGWDFQKAFPLVVIEQENPLTMRRPNYVPPLISNGMNRALMTAFILLGAGLLARFVFGVWRNMTLNRDEGTLILLDTAWSENRRELNRQEKWRAQARERALGLTSDREKSGCLFYVAAVLVILLAGFSLTCCVSLFR
jgi:hypothetical protein